MTIKQQTHTKMFIAVLGVLDQYNNIWQAVSAISTARGKLAAVISDIRAAELKQSIPTTGVTENKRLARRAMCQSAALVAGAVAAYADNAGKHDIFDTVDFSAADLLHQTEADCVTNSTAIFNAGTANLTALTPLGTLAAADLTDLNTKIGAFNTLFAQPRQTKAHTKSATDVLPELIDNGDRLCERQLDRLMERYKDSNSAFFGAYKVARIIVDAPSGHGSDETNPPTPPTPPPA